MSKASRLRQVLAALFGRDEQQRDWAFEQLRPLRGEPLQARSREDARAVVEAFAWRSPTAKRRRPRPVHALLGLVLRPGSKEAADFFREAATPAIVEAWPTLESDERGVALKVLVLFGTREALRFFAACLLEEDGAHELAVIAALNEVDPQTALLDELLPALEPVLDSPGSSAVAVLELANRLADEERLATHPAGARLERLGAWIRSREPSELRFALAAVHALAHLDGRPASALRKEALFHPSPEVRLQAIHARCRQDEPGAELELARAVLDPRVSKRARELLEMLGKSHLVPAAASDPEFLARSELMAWLAHPMEFGRPPQRMELWDRRLLRWPPTEDERELFLYRYTYVDAPGGPETGVGLVGSITVSLSGDARPDPEGSPEEALAVHCAWELQQAGLRAERQALLASCRRQLGFAKG